MTSKPEELWPNYIPLPQEDIFAVGVIALNYSQLESMFRAILSYVARWNDHQSAAVFYRLANNSRKDILSELLAKTTIPDEIKSLIEHFSNGYSVCADNRNFIMHSSLGGMHDGGLVLQRFSRAGNKMECYATLDILKNVADEMHNYMSFGASVAMDVHNYSARMDRGESREYRPSPLTLSGKPPPPTPLNWQIPADPKERELPHFALQTISAFRIRDI